MSLSKNSSSRQPRKGGNRLVRMLLNWQQSRNSVAALNVLRPRWRTSGMPSGLLYEWSFLNCSTRSRSMWSMDLRLHGARWTAPVPGLSIVFSNCSWLGDDISRLKIQPTSCVQKTPFGFVRRGFVILYSINPFSLPLLCLSLLGISFSILRSLE